MTENIEKTNGTALLPITPNTKVNPKVKLHADVCEYLNDLYAKKNYDYGDSFHQTFVEEGMAMARIRLGDKFGRFKTLSKSSGQQVSDESLKDTLLDLANYAIMTVMEMELQEGKHIKGPDSYF